ncbi:hypothetical protein V1522DRAFT_417610 [Lipomyces starkeyi]
MIKLIVHMILLACLVNTTVLVYAQHADSYTHHVLLNGTTIMLADSLTLTQLVNADKRVLAQYMYNLSLIDRDQRARGEERSYVTIVDQEQVSHSNHNNDSHTTLARRSDRNLCYLKFFAEVSYVDWRTYYNVYTPAKMFQFDTSWGMKSMWWVPYCATCGFNWYNDEQCTDLDYNGSIWSDGGRSSVRSAKEVTCGSGG